MLPLVGASRAADVVVVQIIPTEGEDAATSPQIVQPLEADGLTTRSSTVSRSSPR